ncbi:MAG TPA: diacylglycerol kinase family protein [Actinomycetota bacterium]
MAPRVVVLVNPSSGRGRSGRLLPRVREAIAAAGLDAEIRVSVSAEDPPRVARECVEAGVGIVAAMGGDGMTGMVGAVLIGTDTALGVIPTGTGNDFARFIGLNRKKPLEAVRTLADPDIRAIDAVRVTGGGREERFVNVAGAGFDSEVNETANDMTWKVQGTAKYVAAVVKTLRRFTAAQFEVTVDGESRSLSGMLIAVGNGQSYGGGMKVVPNASLTDGQLEVCVVGGMSKGQFLRAFPKVFRGTHVSHPKVTMLRGARVEISADRGFDVYADGERSVPLPAVFEVMPGALKVAVPRGAVIP